MTDKKALWKRVCVTDPKAVKAITGKQYQGNSPKPYWIVERLTEEFGPCGLGWGFSIVNERMERLTETEILHVAVVRFWYELDGKRGELEQIGQTKAVYAKRDGSLLVDEDAPKKSVTDALVKCASYIGFAGDIFAGRWDDSKYVAWARKQYEEEPEKQNLDGIRHSPLKNDDVPALPPEVQEYIKDLATGVTEAFRSTDTDWHAAAVQQIKSEGLDDLQKMTLWAQLDSKTRSAFKKVEQSMNTQKETA
jgi:hypothetical protein